MLIDTHCHLNLTDHFPDPATEIAFAKASGVDKLIVIGIDLETSQIALDLGDRFPEVYAGVGIHPNYAAKYKPEMIEGIEAMTRHPKCAAIGEIGLDYHWDYATREEQYAALSDQLDLASRNKLPVVFHCREAYGDLLDILEARVAQKSAPWLLHCFAGNKEDAERAKALDCYFGVDGPLTYKNATELREIVFTLPRDRVVVETDAPYLTPAPHRGKPNRPGYVMYVSNMLASLWQISNEAAAIQTTENAHRVFTGIASPDC